MTFRYNPQSIEKQVRQWPVLFSETDLHKDIILRVNQLWSGDFSTRQGFLNPFSCILPFDKEIITEYGIDACRIAAINSGNQQPDLLLEPSFKWLAKLHDSLNSTQSEFNPVPWLEAVIQAKDHIINRNSDRLALALVMKALKEAAPSISLKENEKALITAAIFPFAPVYAASTSCIKEQTMQIKSIIDSFQDYECVKIALENGGWHWQVFSRKIFHSEPEKELKRIKWINKATRGRKISIKSEDGGIRICFS